MPIEAGPLLPLCSHSNSGDSTSHNHCQDSMIAQSSVSGSVHAEYHCLHTPSARPKQRARHSVATGMHPAYFNETRIWISMTLRRPLPCNAGLGRCCPALHCRRPRHRSGCGQRTISMSQTGAGQPASSLDNSGKQYVHLSTDPAPNLGICRLLETSSGLAHASTTWQQLVNCCPRMCSALYGGLSWGAGALILGAAGWAVVQNAGYTALLKVIAGGMCDCFIPIRLTVTHSEGPAQSGCRTGRRTLHWESQASLPPLR